MRQAGRYLPEYRELRKGIAFMDMCRDVERAVAVTLQPIDLVGAEAAILFQDIFTPIPSLGIDVDFAPGPKIADPLRSLSQVEALRVSRPEDDVPFVFEILRRLRAALEPKDIPLLGFAGAPFTLAAYLVEGSGSKDFAILREAMEARAPWLELLLQKLEVLTVDYLRAQVDAGAQAGRLVDPWAGLLSVEEYKAWVLPSHQRILAALDPEQAPRILFVRDGGHVVKEMAESGADVISLDWRVDIGAVADEFGDRVSVQGNLDPEELALPRDEIFRRVREIASAASSARGHVLNLGHGCMPHTPVEGVRAFTDAARALEP